MSKLAHQRNWITVGLLLIIAGGLASCGAREGTAILDARSTTGLAYDLVGDGAPSLVLIHGTNLDRRMWDFEMTWLPALGTTLRYDLRGQGASDFPSVPFSNHQDLLALLDELGADRVDLIGLSAGAQVALDVALAAPERVRQLILVSPSLSGFVPDEMPPFFGDLMAALQAQDFARANQVLLNSSIMAVPEQAAAKVKQMVEDNERLWTIPYSLVEQPSPPAIEHLQDVIPPTLLLTGVRDLVAIHDQGRLLEERLSNVRHLHISSGGHLLNLTAPGAFRRELTAFLKRSLD
jgi:pimeloyl-ACP methyl ester carboxylesterase